MFAALLFSQQKQIIFPLLLNRYVDFSVFCFLLHFFKQQSPEEQLLSGSLARTIMLCNGDHLPAVNNIIYLVRQALVQCIWGPKAGFHQEQRWWHCAQGLVLGALGKGGNVHCSPPPADGAWGQAEGFAGWIFVFCIPGSAGTAPLRTSLWRGVLGSPWVLLPPGAAQLGISISLWLYQCNPVKETGFCWSLCRTSELHCVLGNALAFRWSL